MRREEWERAGGRECRPRALALSFSFLSLSESHTRSHDRILLQVRLVRCAKGILLFRLFETTGPQNSEIKNSQITRRTNAKEGPFDRATPIVSANSVVETAMRALVAKRAPGNRHKRPQLL